MPWLSFGDEEETKDAVLRHRMTVEDKRHEINRFIEELNAEQLITLKFMLNIFSSGDASYAAYLEGTVAATLTYKFNRCGGCGGDHEKDLLEDEAKKLESEAVAAKEHSITILRREFNVRKGPADTVICNACEKQYISLADRMLQKDCEGCHHRSAWG